MFPLSNNRLAPAALLVALSASAIALPARADDAAALRKIFVEPLVTVNRWSELPHYVRSLVSVRWEGEGRSIADPGQPFQESDFVSEPGLPRRRLIVAAHSKHAWIVYYERGGMAPSFHLAVCPFEGKAVAHFGVMPPLGEVEDGLERLRAVIEKGQTWASQYD